MWGAALRRFGKLFAGAAVGIAIVAALVGLLLGASLSRSISLAYYCVGSFLLVAGFFIGNRGPLRLKRETADSSFFGPRVMRHASLEEREDSLNNSAVFVTLGLALIALGVLADTRYRLV